MRTNRLRVRQEKKAPSQKAGSTDSVLSAILKKLPTKLQREEKDVLRLSTDYQASRLKLGKLLFQVQKELAPKRLFKKYLRLRNIPTTTSYDVIRAYKSPEKIQRKRPKPYSFEEHQEQTFAITSNRAKSYFLSVEQTAGEVQPQLRTFVRELAQHFIKEGASLKLFFQQLADGVCSAPL